MPRVTVGKQSKNSSRVWLPSKYSKSDRTGTRVPAKTGTPPRISGLTVTSELTPNYTNRSGFDAESRFLAISSCTSGPLQAEATPIDPRNSKGVSSRFIVVSLHHTAARKSDRGFEIEVR